MYIREDMADIRVSVDGVPYGASWKSIEGANLEADDAKTRPGGMGREVSIGGPASRDDATCSIQLTDVVIGWHKTLENRIGVARAKASYTFLGPERTPMGASHTVVGTLKSVTLPDMDSESSDAAMYTLVISCDEQAA